MALIYEAAAQVRFMRPHKHIHVALPLKIAVISTSPSLGLFRKLLKHPLKVKGPAALGGEKTSLAWMPMRATGVKQAFTKHSFVRS